MSRGGFAKVYETILRSSVWLEDVETRLVWITMLILADAKGILRASIGGLAHQARVSREGCERALQILQAPDPDDQSGVDEGRRVRRVEDGWFIVNHKKHRDFRTQSQIAAAERVRKHRKRHRAPVTGNDVTVGNAPPASASGSGSIRNPDLLSGGQGPDDLLLTPAPDAPRANGRADRLDAQAAEVFAHWQQVLLHPQTKATRDRIAKIRTRLREGASVATCKAAIEGCRASPHHMGENDEGTVYDSVSLIFRNAEKLDYFASIGQRPAAKAPGPPPPCPACRKPLQGASVQTARGRVHLSCREEASP